MLFSIVIPTRNRLHLLRDAIETIRRQDTIDEWELVVFDNCSVDPIEAHIKSLNDPRIRYERSDTFLPVTDSWNRAIELARGDYVTLLGDDDGLIPGYFSRLRSIIKKFNSPDIIYNNFFQFWFPGVAPWRPAPHVLEVRHGFFFGDQKEPFLLSREDANKAATGSLRMKINFSFNSQAFVYHKSFLDRLRADGPIYRSPFPDYYIANTALVRSRLTVIVPEPLAIAGVSKASYGFALYNDEQERGESLLNIDLFNDPVYREMAPALLPGPAYNTNFVVSMEYVARSTKKELGVEVDLDRYRRLQIYDVLIGRQRGAPVGKHWPELRKQLSWKELVFSYLVRFTVGRGRNLRIVRTWLAPRILRSVNMTGFAPMPRYYSCQNLEKVSDVYSQLETGALA